MSNIFEVQGKLINFSLTNQDLICIKSAQSKDDIGTLWMHIWDKIRSWFSGCDLVNAKGYLFDFCSQQTPDYIRLQSFEKLKNMVTEAHQDRFIKEENSDGVKYIIKDDEGQICYCLDLERLYFDTAKIESELNNNKCYLNNKELKRTLSCIELFINKEKIFSPDKSGDELLDDLIVKLQALGCSDSEVYTICSLCQRSTFSIFVDGESPYIRSAPGDGPTTMHIIKNSGDDLNVFMENVKDVMITDNIYFTSQELFDMKMEVVREDPYCVKSEVISAHLVVEKDGNISLQHATCFVNKGQ